MFRLHSMLFFFVILPAVIIFAVLGISVEAVVEFLENLPDAINR